MMTPGARKPAHNLLLTTPIPGPWFSNSVAGLTADQELPPSDLTFRHVVAATGCIGLMSYPDDLDLGGL